MAQNDESEVVLHDGGMTFAGPDAVGLFRATALKNALAMYKRSGIIPTRGMTITRMLQSATGYTQKKYTRRKLDIAIDDMEKWITAMKTGIPIADKRTEAGASQ